MGYAYFDNVVDLASFCAQLVKDGIAFKVSETRSASDAGRYCVELTGY